MGEIIDLGVSAGLVDKAGAWYSYKEQRIGQGRENVKVFLEQHPEIAQEIEKKILAQSGILSDAMLEGEVGSQEEAAETAEAPLEAAPVLPEEANSVDTAIDNQS